ncbi:DUF7689 domain-containing protein [Desulfoluna butyratoxydans]|nr:hypothetical protein [Desulfoluna butyratoxydans]
MNIELRKQLGDIPKEEHTKQQIALSDLKNHYVHSINVIDSSHLFHEWGTYNCFEYALRLTNSSDYVEIKKQHVFANSEFIQYLIINNLISKAQDNGLIIYFNDEQKPTHAGIFENHRVLSKWGTGLVFDHEIFEAPFSYGSQYRIYETVESATMIEYFFDYAELHGIKFYYE